MFWIKTKEEYTVERKDFKKKRRKKPPSGLREVEKCLNTKEKRGKKIIVKKVLLPEELLGRGKIKWTERERNKWKGLWRGRHLWPGMVWHTLHWGVVLAWLPLASCVTSITKICTRAHTRASTHSYMAAQSKQTHILTTVEFPCHNSGPTQKRWKSLISLSFFLSLPKRCY